MDKAIRLKRPGGTDQLQWEDWPAQPPGPGEIRLRHEAIGVNFIDIYHRTGLYPLPDPAIPGVDGAGIVEALGEGVDHLVIGQRVAYAGLPGAYATTRLLPAWRAVPLPDEVDPAVAAGSMLRGLTVHMLLTRTYPVGPGTTILIHAAAGGLGTMMARWAKRLGATVIGTAGSSAKADLARSCGADHVIVGRDADFASEVKALTTGHGVDFAVDGIGGATLLKTLDCVRRFGMVASIGQAAGSIPAIAVEEIGPIRSLSFARPSVMAYGTERDTYPAAASDVVAMIASGIAPPIAKRYELADAPSAQADLEAGRFAGAAILVP